MPELEMPPARDFGWKLKPLESSLFAIHKRDNGQFCVVLNHALLRGVSAEMIHWWFLHFTNLQVRLRDVPGYDGMTVPAYLLWHPVDHVSATLRGNLGPGRTARPGCSIQIREAMQYDTYGWKYPVDATLKVVYVGEDGWAMGKVLPVVGTVMMLRIHFKDVFDGSQLLGVHYHYEVVVGASGRGPVSKFVNERMAAHYAPEFFEAWQRHNVIEVGTFENFLPALYAQKEQLPLLEYAPEMNGIEENAEPQSAFNKALFEERLAGYRDADDPGRFQRPKEPGFL